MFSIQKAVVLDSLVIFFFLWEINFRFLETVSCCKSHVTNLPLPVVPFILLPLRMLVMNICLEKVSGLSQHVFLGWEISAIYLLYEIK